MGIKPPQLNEKDFINENPKSPFFSSLIFVLIVAAVAGLFWLGANWMMGQVHARLLHSPFLNVTNREMSLFLWQNPEYMRINAQTKTGYLPGFFSVNRATMKADAGDDIVSAPPDILFLYHTWNRLISNEWTPRPIQASEFQKFLKDAAGWLPENWPEAPKSYAKYLKNLGDKGLVDLKLIPEDVQKAFQGWLNYYKEGDQINHFIPTYEEIAAFIKKYPHYDRPYWRNIVGDQYLKTYTFGKMDPNAKVAKDQLAPFLRVALFNWKAAQEQPQTPPQK